MYNRYIPQPDGSYQRNRIPEPQKPNFTKQEPQPSPVPLPQPPQEPVPVSFRSCVHRPQPQIPAPKCRSNTVTGFLKQLLPGDFCVEDLMVVLLLLLMAGDCHEEQNTALLTLALYLFL